MTRSFLLVAVILASGCDKRAGGTQADTQSAGRVAATPTSSPQVRSFAVHWPANQDAYQLGVLDSLKVAIPSCGDTAVAFTVNAVGPLRPGQTLQQITSLCAGFLPMWDWGDEGIPEPVLLVRKRAPRAIY
ncbi:MAG: hypothetical protein ABI625_18845 [bacterium]